MRQFHAQMIDNLKAGMYVPGSKALPVSDEDVDAFVLFLRESLFRGR